MRTVIRNSIFIISVLFAVIGALLVTVSVLSLEAGILSVWASNTITVAGVALACFSFSYTVRQEVHCMAQPDTSADGAYPSRIDQQLSNPTTGAQTQ